MMTTFIIGDVHGCLDSLNALLSALNLCAGDQIIFAGDLVHKGPNSEGVVRRVMALAAEGYDVVLVRGNHEEKALKQRALNLTPEEWLFLASAQLWYAASGFVVTHGGIPSELEALPLDPRSVDALSNSKRKHFDRMCRTRYLTPEGKFVALQDVSDQDKFWAETYDGRFGFVYFGHEPFYRATSPVWYPHAMGLDLGAVFGGHLCAAELKDGRFATFHAVKAAERFAEPFDTE